MGRHRGEIWVAFLFIYGKFVYQRKLYPIKNGKSKRVTQNKATKRQIVPEEDFSDCSTHYGASQDMLLDYKLDDADKFALQGISGSRSSIFNNIVFIIVCTHNPTSFSRLLAKAT